MAAAYVIPYTQKAGAKLARAWQNLGVMHAVWQDKGRREALLRFLFVAALWLAATTEAPVREGLLAAPLPRGIAGTQAASNDSNRAPSNELVDQIEEALSKEDRVAARRLVPKLLEEPGLTVDILLRTGIHLAQHDLYSESSELFGRCTRDHPAVFEAFYNLSLAQLALRRPQDALATLAKVSHTSPEEETARTYLRGKIELALQKDTEAERDLAAAFAAAPQEENVALDLGLCYIRERKYQAAVEVYRKAAGFQKNSAFLRLGLALAQYLGGLNAESVETCRALLTLQPGFSPARVMMAFALYMEGKTDEAARIAARGLHDPQPFPYLYYVHAASLLKLQSTDFGTIENDLTLAAQSIPACSLCYVAMGKAHRREGQLDTARADLERATRLDPTLAEAWYNLAAVYDQAGQHAEAQQARHRFEELKANKTNRETEMLRDVFLKTLGGDGTSEEGP